MREVVVKPFQSLRNVHSAASLDTHGVASTIPALIDVILWRRVASATKLCVLIGVDVVATLVQTTVAVLEYADVVRIVFAIRLHV